MQGCAQDDLSGGYLLAKAQYKIAANVAFQHLLRLDGGAKLS